jgi:hypothetical protein
MDLGDCEENAKVILETDFGAIIFAKVSKFLKFSL